MPRTLTAADRSALIRLASILERGSESRRAILRFALDLEDQLFVHPDTGNRVKFKSLPAKEQEKIRAKGGKEDDIGRAVSISDKKPKKQDWSGKDTITKDDIKELGFDDSRAMESWVEDFYQPDWQKSDDPDWKEISEDIYKKQTVTPLDMSRLQAIAESVQSAGHGRGTGMLDPDWAKHTLDYIQSRKDKAKAKKKERSKKAADRSALIRLASTLPVGSPERKAILDGLRR